MLYIIPTPIGNLKDITLRSIEALQNCDGVICEDSRRTATLLNHYQITKPFLVLNDYNEAKQFPEIIEKLKLGQNLALVSDAGTPLINDPGYKLVRECIAQKIEVDSLPGPASPIVALTLSGLPPDKFTFMGYPPDKPSHRQKFYEKIAELSNILPVTFIVFVAPFKLFKTLSEMEEIYGDMEVTLAAELTKIFQKVKTKKISEWIRDFGSKPPKGEWIMLLRPQS